MLESYAANGTGTVRGVKDREKQIQIEFWQRAANEGFTDERASASAHKFRVAFDALEQRLAQHSFLMGDNLNVLDIAWLIYAHRLSLAGYPFVRLHPRVAMWMQRLRDKPEFAKEIAMPPEAVKRLEATRRAQMEAGKTLEGVAGF
jgi:glutathione S-transferase